MRRNELEAFIMETYNAEADYPWRKSPNHAVFRHCSNRKWFALIMDVPKNKVRLRDYWMWSISNATRSSLVPCGENPDSYRRIT